MTNPDLTDLADLYSESLRKHGTTPMGVGWRDIESQGLRFDKLLQGFDLTQPFFMNELGCGYGALFDHLQRKNLPVLKFRGHEISQEMLRVAKSKIGQFSCVELLGSSRLDQVADFSIASGIFNVRLDCEEGEWDKYVLSVLENLNAHSKNGFAFNALSTYVDFYEPHLYYANPVRFFDYCKRNFSRHVSLLHDYALYEWTIVVKK